MRFAKYWAQIECPVFDDQKVQRTIHLFGWSDQSAADAEAHARSRAAKVKLTYGRREGNPWYLYDDRPLREPILEDLSKGESRVVITRSRLGPKVLNTDRVAFVDIDVYNDHDPQRGPSRRHGFFDRLLGRPDPMGVRRAAIREWCQRHSDFGLHLYETKNGFRGIITDRLLEPRAERTLSLFKELGADELYIRLCKGQECFRARLSAKPWRIGAPVLSASFPYTFSGTSVERNECMRRDDEIAAQYDGIAEGYAACRFSEHFGRAIIHPEVQRVIDIHDAVSGATSSKPVA